VELITKVAAAAVAAGRPPVTLVILSGGALDIRFAKDDANVGAILWAGYAGQSGGNAVADALFGISPPAGRLTQTWYDASFTKAIAFTDMNMRPNATTGSPGRTHRFYTGTPVYPFGAGITMTQWRYTVASNAITLDTATATTTTRGSTQTASSTHVTVHVENIGSLASDHVVLAFLSAPDAGVNGTPLRSLAAYARLAAVAPGETRDVSFDLDATTLCAALGADTSTSSSGQPRPILLGRYTLRLDSGTVEEAITLALNVV
jgi:beta-D-xylosidase 4